jgi:prefoldin subunit 4
MKAADLRDDIKKLKEEIDNLEDATLLVEESMGEGLKLFLGECFVTVDEDQGMNYVEKLTSEKQEELEAKNDQLDKLEADMKSLKSYLYARFGSSINLDELKD